MHKHRPYSLIVSLTVLAAPYASPFARVPIKQAITGIKNRLNETTTSFNEKAHTATDKAKSKLSKTNRVLKDGYNAAWNKYDAKVLAFAEKLKKRGVPPVVAVGLTGLGIYGLSALATGTSIEGAHGLMMNQTGIPDSNGLAMTAVTSHLVNNTQIDPQAFVTNSSAVSKVVHDYLNQSMQDPNFYKDFQTAYTSFLNLPHEQKAAALKGFAENFVHLLQATGPNGNPETRYDMASTMAVLFSGGGSKVSPGLAGIPLDKASLGSVLGTESAFLNLLHNENSTAVPTEHEINVWIQDRVDLPNFIQKLQTDAPSRDSVIYSAEVARGEAPFSKLVSTISDALKSVKLMPDR